jgi:carbamate kinase
MRIVLALGGNALLHRGEHPYPLDALNVQTRGLIGYWLVRDLDRALGAKPTAALMTRVLVDRDDPAFAIPSKFVGESYGEGEAHALSSAYGWTMAAQDGMSWRRVVPAPVPVAIPELPAIAHLLSAGSTVVCCGGRGIPVVRDADGVLHGVVAVVDTDLTSALLATQLGADVLVLLTDVDAVHSDYEPSTAYRSGTPAPSSCACCAFRQDPWGRRCRLRATLPTLPVG